MSDAISRIEIGPLFVRQRRATDEYRAAEKVVQGLHKSLSTKSFDRAARAETEAIIVTRTAELMSLGRQMLKVEASGKGPAFI